MKRVTIFIIMIATISLFFTMNCKKDDNNNNDNPEGTVTDIDGNVYHTVKIGSQVWMVENLRTTRLNDGSKILLVTDDDQWEELLNTPGFCFYNNNANNDIIYGKLYNWDAVNFGKLCPIGWHVPSNAEWYTLTTYLGGNPVAGGKMKEAGTAHWASPNTGATNSSGFTALPGGSRNYLGFFSAMTYNAYFWSSSDYWFRYLSSESEIVYSNYSYYNDGFSCRCLKD